MSIPTDPAQQDHNYQVHLPAFEGPLDLLLHLIKKDEINIYDIPIAQVTREYLHCLDLMKSLNLNVAGEFLVMAATLIHIKSRTLLPVEEQSQEDLEEDPRADLVQRLLEYQRFKDSADYLEDQEKIWCNVFRREAQGPLEEQNGVPMGDVSLFDLLGALQNIMDRVTTDQALEIVADELSVRERISWVMRCLDQSDMLRFESLFEDHQTPTAIVTTFLAVLELIRLRQVSIQQVRLFEPIWIWKAEQIDESAPVG